VFSWKWLLGEGHKWDLMFTNHHDDDSKVERITMILNCAIAEFCPSYLAHGLIPTCIPKKKRQDKMP